jgi:hypothetical protein
MPRYRRGDTIVIAFHLISDEDVRTHGDYLQFRGMALAILQDCLLP